MARKISRQPTATRAAWGSMSRAQVVDAAADMVAGESADELTIRALARRLEVSPMSLYRHVDSLDDLLAEVADRLLALTWQPVADPAAWRAWTIEAADRLRALIVEHPVVRQVYLQGPVVTPSAIARMEAMLDVLRSVTPDEDTARAAYAAVHTYTVGFATLEASRERRPLPDDADQTLIGLAAHTSPTQFLHGLGYLLDGIPRRARRRR